MTIAVMLLVSCLAEAKGKMNDRKPASPNNQPPDVKCVKPLIEGIVKGDPELANHKHFDVQVNPNTGAVSFKVEMPSETIPDGSGGTYQSRPSNVVVSFKAKRRSRTACGIVGAVTKSEEH
jgi:hypothetical protein